MIQVKICHYEHELNNALEELQNEGFPIQDIKFSVADSMLDWSAMIIYDDNSKYTENIIEMLKTCNNSNTNYGEIEVKN